MRRVWLAVVVLVGCSDDGGGSLPDGSGPDGPPAVDAPPDTPRDAAVDAPPDADPNATVISAVATDAGLTQICHSCIETIVITGANLQGTTAVRIGAIDAFVLSMTSTEIRAKVRIPDGFPPGALDVAIDGPSGTTTAPAAIEVTFVTAAANAPFGGRGVPQSPANLCDPELWVGSCTQDETLGWCPHAPMAPSTLHLLAGTHVCDNANPSGGITVEGDGAGITTVESHGAFAIAFDNGFLPPDATTIVRNVSFAGTPTSASLLLFTEHYQIQSVVDDGGIVATSSKSVTVDGYTYTGPASRIALDLTPIDAGNVAVTNTLIASCKEGLSLKLADTFAGAGLTMASTRIERCSVGIRLAVPPTTFSAQFPLFEITGVQLHDNTVGIAMAAGSGTLRDVVITDDEATAPAGTTGLSISNGDVTFLGGRIEGQTTGVSMFASTDTAPSVATDGLTIIGGQIGIGSRALGDQPVLRMRRTTVRDQTGASVTASGDEGILDLGTAADPGQNVLSVVSGFALDDARTNTLPTGQTPNAVGTTLNGHSYAGQLLQGPLTIGSDLRIADFRNAWQF
ncbi:MAG TPA: hypothetical protein VFQ53_19195 [Kofleriaceae bacterium]|nr:hypothetical protein [Kofleriaceae bacterium]